MTSRERIMAVLHGKTPDRTPWSPCMDDYFTRSLEPNEDGTRPDVIDACRMIGADIMLRHVGAYRVVCPEVKYETLRHADVETDVIETPVGRIEQRFIYSGNVRSPLDHKVKSAEDLKVIAYMYEAMSFEPDSSYYHEVDRRIGSDGIATLTAEASPIKLLMDSFTGLEAMAYLLADYPKEMEDLMGIMHRSNMERLRIMLHCPAEVVISYEDTSTTVISGNWYRQYCSPYINDYADLAHAGGKLFITHMCGKIKGFTELIGADRMDGIDSLCPPETGDLWACEALEKLPGKLIIGGLDPVSLYTLSTDEIDGYVEKCLRDTTCSSRFILSTGDAVAYGTPVENLKAVTNAVKKYGAM